MSLTKVSFSMIDGAVFNVLDYGADPTGTTDSTSAFQDAVTACAIAGGGTVFSPRGTYSILGTVLWSSNVSFDFDASSLVGAGIGVNTMFETGYLSGSTILSNIATGPEANRVVDSIVDGKGADFSLCNIAFNMKNFNEVCAIQNIRFINCTYALKGSRCFYARYINLRSTGSASGATNGGYTFDNLFGQTLFESCSINDRVLGWDIKYSLSGVKFQTCSAESCGDGFRIDYGGDAGPVVFDGCYLELITNTGIEYVGTQGINDFKVVNSFFNTMQTGIKARVARTGQFENNYFTSVTTEYDVTDIFTLAETKLKNSTVAVDSLPTLVTSSSFGTASTPSRILNIRRPSDNKSLAKTFDYSDIAIPFNYIGDVGQYQLAGYMPFCKVTRTETSPGVWTIDIDTKIVWRPETLMVGYVIRANDTSTTYNNSGFIMGDTISETRTSALTVAVSDNSGYLRVTLTSVGSAAGFTSGVIRHL